jgi:hypothetical protein
MKVKHLNKLAIAACVLGIVFVLGIGMGYADGDEMATYNITIQNLTRGQPLSPIVGATHEKKIGMFKVGELASGGLEAIAEDGDQTLMFNRFFGLIGDQVTSAFGKPPGMPSLTPSGTMVGNFTDALTRTVMAGSRDRFSMATMLICTNDGFTGLDRVKLPRKGAMIFLLNGYDAGTEMNTELSADIVDPCSALGPLMLAGDPNGNNNIDVDMDPHVPIMHHPNIKETGDLTCSDHVWTDPVAKVTITRVDENGDEFMSRLSGEGEVPPVDTFALGRARFKLDDDHDSDSDNDEDDGDDVKDESGLRFKLNVHDIEGVTQAHIHYGLPNENGPVVAFLFGLVAPTDEIDGRLSDGTITEDNLLDLFVGDFAGFAEALRSGMLYVNVHTDVNPSGEIRGQIGAK